MYTFSKYVETNRSYGKFMLENKIQLCEWCGEIKGELDEEDVQLLAKGWPPCICGRPRKTGGGGGG